MTSVTSSPDAFGIAGSGIATVFGGSAYGTVASPVAGIGTGEFAIEVVAKPASVTGTLALFNLNNNGNGEVFQNGTQLAWYNGSTQSITANLAIGVPYTVLVTRTGTARDTYLNGRIIEAARTDSVNYGATNTFALGAYSSAFDRYNGSILSWRVYKRFITASEAFSMYAAHWSGVTRQIIIPSAPAAAETYTLSSATYAPGSITATGVTPRVSVAVT
jgi:hypothetical protein